VASEVLKVRFGKRTRTLATAGRRLLGNRREVGDEAVVAEERHALLGSLAEEETMTPLPEDAPAFTGDPTQHLLTALGRFQRQVARAEGGAPQDAWTDECMGQLIAGIEVAYAQGWRDVQEAMTDAARVLQSYEDAGHAALSVPFLQDSYEILCLMVGDLIVDNVRSGVIEKWRQRYQRATEDLAKAGITLVEDDEPPEDYEENAPPPASLETETAALQWDPPAPSPPWEPDISMPEPELTEFVPEPAVQEPQFDAEILSGETAPFDLPPECELETFDSGNLPSLDELLPPEPAEPLPARVLEPLPPAEPEPAALVEVLDTPAAPPAQDTLWVEDLDTSIEEAPQPEPEPPAAAEPEPSPKPDPGGDLLRTAQAAMVRGDVADAKLSALRLAAAMAQLEAENTEARLKAAEERIEADNQALEAATKDVALAEQRVQSAESRMSEREAEFQTEREQMGALRDQMAHVEASIADLENQIRALQAQRDEEAARLDALRREMDEASSAESRIQTDLESMTEAEQMARDTLEDCRQRVIELQDARTAHREEAASTRAELEQRRQSVIDIERTIGLVAGIPPKPETAANGDLLF
jgi:predicted  nucleic acid-binding Zn-ribbon protein